MRPRLIRVGALATGLLAATLVAVAAPVAEYEIRLEAPATIEQGKGGEVSVTITPRAGRQLSSDGPLRIAVAIAPDKGLSLSRRVFHRQDAVDPKAEALRFNLTATGETPGRYEVDLDIRFWICGKRTCRPVRQRRKVEITVVTASEPAGPPGPADPADTDGSP